MEIKTKKVFFSLLIILFAFQIAFVSVVVYYFVTHKVVFEKNHDNEDRYNFQEIKDNRPEIHKKYRDNVFPLREKNRELRIEFLSEIIKAQPDYDHLSKLNDQIQEITEKISQNFYNEMIEVRKTFTPQEAEQFFGHQLKMMHMRFDQSMHQDEMGHHPPGEQPRARQNRFKNRRNIE